MPRELNLVGQRFGRLVAIRPNGNNANKKTTWLCQCDCGNQCSIVTSQLTTGKTKSCGCYRKELNQKRFLKDNVGKTFNHLTVLEIMPNYLEGKKRRVFYRCKCVCGKEILARGTSVSSGNVKSCGCKSREKQKQIAFKKRKNNKIEIEGDIARIYLSNCDMIALIDAWRVKDIEKYYWGLVNGYVCSVDRDSRKHIKLHRIIARNNTKQHTDHINRNKLDNRESNLRIVSPAINSQNIGISPLNTTGHKNIVRCSTSKSKFFEVNFVRFGITYYVGKFSTLQEALEARNKKYIELGIPIED